MNRPGAMTIYTQDWNIDVIDFINSKKKNGDDRLRLQDTYTAICVHDLFMYRLERGMDWTLFDYKDVPELTETYGEEFEKHYIRYEKLFQEDPSKFNKNTKTIKCKELAATMFERYVTDGNPFIYFIDTANRANPHKHLGIIRSSNLCFTGDTLVYVDDPRRTVTIKELAEYSNGEIEFKTFCATFDPKRGWIKTSQPAVAVKTSDAADIICLKLESGELIKCTPNHEFAQIDGSYIEAQYTLNNYITRDGNQLTKVIKIINMGKQPTYDLTVKNHHNFFIQPVTANNEIVNGAPVLVHNCMEILMPTDFDKTAVCNLGSINISRLKSKEEFEEIVPTILRAMDNFIDLTDYPSNKSEHWQKQLRSIGLGFLGIGEYLANNKIMYGSQEHIDWINDWFSKLDEVVNKVNKELAIEKGSCAVKEGVRNAYTRAIAPNSSSGLFAGTTNSHEAVYAKIWTEENKLGEYPITAPHLSLDNINYYVNPYQVGPEKCIDATAALQKYVDMGISHNIYLDPNEYANGIPLSRIRDIVLYAWKKGIKTLYYFRSKAPKNSSSKKTGIVCEGCDA